MANLIIDYIKTKLHDRRFLKALDMTKSEMYINLSFRNKRRMNKALLSSRDKLQKKWFEQAFGEVTYDNK